MDSVPASVGFYVNSSGTECETLSSELLERLSIETPLGHFRFCLSLLDRIRSSHIDRIDEIERHCELLALSPFASNFQPSIAAIALLSDFLQMPVCPVEANLFSSGAPKGMLGGGWISDQLLALPIAHQLALLWEELALKREDPALLSSAKLALAWVRAMGGEENFLFCREGIYLPSSGNSEKECCFAADACLGSAGFHSESSSSYMTLSGWNSGLGAIRAGGVEVRAFGPQNWALDDTRSFGLMQIRPVAASAHLEGGEFVEPGVLTVDKTASHACLRGWTRSFARPDVWMHLDAKMNQASASCQLRFTGLSPEHRLAMAFYIKSFSCSLESGRVFRPRSLQKYEGSFEPISFDGHLRLECSEKLPIKIIPLAEGDCFWGASFLVCFELNPSVNVISYLFNYNY